MLRIAALVGVQLVVSRPHPLMSRYGDEELAARPDAGGEAGDRRLVILDMFDDVERRDEIVGRARDLRQLGKRRAGDGAAEALLRMRSSFRVDLDSVDRSEPF